MKRLAMRRILGGLAAGAATMALGIVVGGAGPADVAASAPAAETQNAKTMPAGPTANVALVDWSVFLVDSSQARLNPLESFGNTLPSYVNDLRKSPALPDAPAEGKILYAPIGMIRLSPAGAVNADLALDVQLSYKDGRVLGRWPAGKTRSEGVLWQDVRFAGEKDQPRELPADSWLEEARRGAGHDLLVGTVAEGFLLYDLEVAYPANLRVAAGEKDGYKVVQSGAAPLLDLTFYKHEGNGWRSAALARLAKPEAAATTAPAAATAPRVSALAVTPPSSQPATQAPTRSSVIVAALRENATGPAPKAPEAPPAPPEELKGTTDVALGALSEPGEKALALWRPVLAQAGVSAGDQELILKILAQYALDPRRLTAVYRMDSAELDRILPLEVVPQPKKISRIALVIVTGIDPAMEQELQGLIAQLGNSSWEKREAAMKEIRKLGAKAKPLLEKAAKDKDVEVQYRVEQLLQILATENGTPEPLAPPQ